jgi:hypothetical protein
MQDGDGPRDLFRVSFASSTGVWIALMRWS